MSYSRNLARIARKGVITVNTAQELRDLTIYGGSYPETVETLGALTVGDGGHGLWRWDAINTETDNLGLVLLPTGHVGAGRWVRQESGDIPAEAFGVTPGASTIAAEFTNALASEGRITLNSSVTLDNTVKFPVNAELVGFGRTAIITFPSGMANKTAFSMNLDAAETNWVEQYPNLPAMVVEGITIEATNAPGSCAFKFGGSVWFKDLRFTGACIGFEQIGVYSDYVRVENVHFRMSQVQGADDWLLNLGALGDSVFINNIAFSEIHDGALRRVPNGLYKVGGSGGIISNVIQGYNKFVRSHGMECAGWHLESGAMVAESSSVNFHDSNVWMRSSNPTFVDFGINPVEFYSDDGEFGGESRIERVFWHRSTNPAWENTYPTDRADLIVRGPIGLDVRQCARRAFNNYNLVGPSTMLGITAGDGTNSWSDFNNYSHFASVKSRFSNYRWHIEAVRGRVISTTGLAGIGTSGSGDRKWLGGNGTYYYACQALFDPIRMVGVAGSTERSVTVTNGGDAVTLVISSEYANGMMLRLYRGLATGSYSHYVDVPILSGFYLFDNGEDVGGFPWVARTAGAMDGLNGNPIGFELRPGIAKTAPNPTKPYGLAVVHWPYVYHPPHGTWEIGDRAICTIKDTATGNNQQIAFWLRLTAGSGNVLNTDWLKVLGTTI